MTNDRPRYDSKQSKDSVIRTGNDGASWVVQWLCNSSPLTRQPNINNSALTAQKQRRDYSKGITHCLVLPRPTNSIRARENELDHSLLIREIVLKLFSTNQQGKEGHMMVPRMYITFEST